ncbi:MULTISPECIES: NAD(P)/FAD-dependent oxidoreductase [unclassified Desulfovibrio]|uniref:phytoene desaturase family protein n=1 Tax=unclassified Desulfovibrio TaxID=2593640 RepID=UPI000F5E9CEC|nr:MULTISPECIES: FAD-dependent oxidoreductase [unclassified Desulfovibrio]RRD71203.1 FAD-dependent oxidoreductase [Desulfovibrio sp. OH1209_COT-279]RRD87491.1 FAD-dependent oxidoreductase [Desulfovibrio sp. OH1186_COT-070]
MRCVVVGSGISGLSAAIFLARQGHAVTVLEAAPSPAPLLRGFRRQGLHFDTGFHCGGGLHKGGVLRRWLRALGVEKALGNIRTGRRDVFRFADGSRYFLPDGHEAVRTAVDRQFPGTGDALWALLQDMERQLAHSPYLNPAVCGEPAPVWHRRGNTDGILQGAGFPAALRAMLGARCLLYGILPHESAWEDYALVAGPYFQSNGSWDGGGAALAAGLLDILQKTGVPVRCGQMVCGLDVSAGRNVSGVFVHDGERLACDLCIFTGHPSQLASIVPGGLFRPAYLHRIADLPESRSALLLFAEARGVLHPGESVYLLPEAESACMFPDLEDDEPCLYLFCDRPQHDGRMAVMAAAFLPPGAPPDSPRACADWKREAVARVRAQAEKRLPGLADAWRVLDAATPLTLRHWIHGATGSLYGVGHHWHTMPLLPVTRLPGLLLAGQNILLPGVLGGIVSAALAVGFAVGHDAVLKEFRQCAENG